MRRRLLIIAIFLLAGAVVNVAATWACALWMRAGYSTSSVVLQGFCRYGDDHSDWHVEAIIGRCTVWVASTWTTGGSQYIGSEPSNTAEEIVPHWAGFVRPDGTGSALFISRYAEASGWPMLAMWSGRAYNPDVGANATIETAVSTKYGYLVPQDRNKRPILVEVVRVLPLAPVWPGFAVNTLFYAVILWLLILAFTLRRLIRRRRGLCPACAYDLRHAEHEACPECGVAA